MHDFYKTKKFLDTNKHWNKAVLKNKLTSGRNYDKNNRVKSFT